MRPMIFAALDFMWSDCFGIYDEPIDLPNAKPLRTWGFPRMSDR